MTRHFIQISADQNARPIFKRCNEEEGKQILSDGICRMLNPGIQLRHKRTKEIYTLDHFRIETRERKKTVAYVMKTDAGKFMVVSGRSELAFRFEMPEDPQLWLGDGI